MNILDDWSHRWFGIWSEFGAVYQECPSAFSFVMPEISSCYPKERLRNYLVSAPIVASASRRNFPNPFTGVRQGGSVSFRTDGKWLWLDDLPDYIENHGVAIPSKWLEDIQSNDYSPPQQVAEEVIERLEWPPTSPLS